MKLVHLKGNDIELDGDIVSSARYQGHALIATEKSIYMIVKQFSHDPVKAVKLATPEFKVNAPIHSITVSCDVVLICAGREVTIHILTAQGEG